MERNILVIVLALLVLTLSSAAQDIHFSQFYQAPLFVNPALTGAFRGDLRATLNYKDQWNSFGAPYKTYALQFDAGLFKNKWERAYLGAGLAVFNDVAGDAKMGTTQANILVSSVVSLNDQMNVSAGISVGFAQRTIKNDEFHWGNQFVNGTYDEHQLDGEPSRSYAAFGYGDFDAGLNWNYAKRGSNVADSKELRLNLGVAVQHVNAPKQGFLGSVDPLYRKLVVHGGAFIGVADNIAVLPSAILYRQGPSQEINLGLMGRFSFAEDSRISEMAVSLGGYYRYGDAVIPAILFEIKGFTIGVSYDVNISSLTQVSNGRGGVELSLKFINPNPFRMQEGSTNVKFL